MTECKGVCHHHHFLDGRPTTTPLFADVVKSLVWMKISVTRLPLRERVIIEKKVFTILNFLFNVVSIFTFLLMMSWHVSCSIFFAMQRTTAPFTFSIFFLFFILFYYLLFSFIIRFNISGLSHLESILIFYVYPPYSHM